MSLLATKYFEHDGKLTIQRTQDCTPIAEACKAQHNSGYHGSSDMKHVASIPLVIVEAYCNTHGVSFADVMTDRAHMKRIAEDPANAHFRIWKGAL